ncbi:uncharacterized protein VTP21DRAFT_7772 [Calcarisporiella thermophila]|uniref:uncharacterized protein n=1 Tax=Calcarisporiella thermophila TaxID=911321 RepID=UPI003742CFDC
MIITWAHGHYLHATPTSTSHRSNARTPEDTAVRVLSASRTLPGVLQRDIFASIVSLTPPIAPALCHLHLTNSADSRFDPGL